MIHTGMLNSGLTYSEEVSVILGTVGIGFAAICVAMYVVIGLWMDR